MLFYNRLFSGTYFFFIKRENNGVLIYNSYLAYSTLFALLSFHIIFISGLLIFSGNTYLMAYVGRNLLFAFFVSAVGWLVFIRNNKYKLIINRYKKNMTETIKFSLAVNLFMFFFMLAGLAYEVSSWE